jgi:hypothetical protein
MDKHEKAVRDGDEAARILNSPMFAAAFSDTRAAMLEAWAKLDNSNGEQAKDLHRMVKCLDRVRRCLEVHIDTGKIAAKEIEGRKRLFEFRRA